MALVRGPAQAPRWRGFAIAGLVILIAIAVWLNASGHSEAGSHIKALSREEAQAMQGMGLVMATYTDIARRVYRGDYVSGAWRKLPIDARAYWLAVGFIDKKHGFVQQLLESEDDQGVPTLAELGEAFEHVSCPDLAGMLRQAEQAASQDQGQAISAWRTFHHRPITAEKTEVKPPPNPLQTLDARFLKEAASSKIVDRLSGYARENLDALLETGYGR